MENYLEVNSPPHSKDLEQEILGSILLNDKLLARVVDDLGSKMFFLKEHSDIFTAMLYLYHNNVGIGYETLVNRLKKKNKEDLMEYVFELRDVFIKNDDFENKVEQLVEIYRKREMYNMSKYMLTEDIEGVASADLVKMYENIVENMGINSNIEYEGLHDYIDDWIDELENPKLVTEYLFPFKGLNDLVTLEPSNLMLIASRPGSGKSAFATEIVKGFCEQKFNPLFVSLEMNKREFMNRLVSIKTGIPVYKFKSKNVHMLTPEEWTFINKAKSEINDWNFNFYDKGSMYVEQLHGLAKYLKKKGELDIIVVDYLQLLSTHKYKGQKVNEVGEISRRLKQMAMELEVPVIALSQLNRGNVSSGETPREPQLSDLRSSGDLEQDANVVLMLHTIDTEQKFGNDEDKERGRWVDLFVRKNRSGALGKVPFEFFGYKVKFYEKYYNKDYKRFEFRKEIDFTNEIDNDIEPPF